MRSDRLGDASTHHRVGILQQMLLDHRHGPVVHESHHQARQNVGYFGTDFWVALARFQCLYKGLDRFICGQDEFVPARGLLLGSAV